MFWISRNENPWQDWAIGLSPLKIPPMLSHVFRSLKKSDIAWGQRPWAEWVWCDCLAPQLILPRFLTFQSLYTLGLQGLYPSKNLTLPFCVFWPPYSAMLGWACTGESALYSGSQLNGIQGIVLQGKGERGHGKGKNLPTFPLFPLTFSLTTTSVFHPTENRYMRTASNNGDILDF